jgi:4-hydroxy-3-methylbut-2-enyl diphosphate reductase
MVEKLYLVTPRGFCAGVEMAIKALTWMLKIYDETIYCYHEIVHNQWIVKEFEKRNVVFVESPDDIPNGAVVMLSAHGTAPDVEKAFHAKTSITINSVCPLVTKVHHEAKKFEENDIEVIYVGHKGHDEAKGAIGVAPNNMHLIENVKDLENLSIKKKVALLAQTTLAISEWEPIMNKAKESYKELQLPRKSDLCYATTNRQKAILESLNLVDQVLVIGSKNSSNTNALVKMVQSKGTEAVRIDDVKDLENIDLKKNIAITAGASAPDHIVLNIAKEINPSETLYLNPINESEYFPLPKELRTNVRNICKFLENLNLSDEEPEKFQGIQNDRNWSATEALASL